MALMFSRLAHNFIKNGYYPTDEATLERCLSALSPSTTTMRIIDPCAGEGVAIAEVACHLCDDITQSYAVEYDAERATFAKQLVDHCLHSDLMDTVISTQTFSLLWLNPPYGDLVKDQYGNNEFSGRPRLEKLFYKRTVSSLQYNGILVFIIPFSVIDKELASWLTQHFTDIKIFSAVDKQFKQAVIFGRRVKLQDISTDTAKQYRNELIATGNGQQTLAELPTMWTLPHYHVPASNKPLKKFHRVSILRSRNLQQKLVG